MARLNNTIDARPMTRTIMQAKEARKKSDRNRAFSDIVDGQHLIADDRQPKMMMAWAGR